MDSYRERFLDNRTAPGAFLACIVGFDFRKLLAGTFSLALQFQSKATPPCIRDALSEVMVLEHVLNLEVLNSYFVAPFKDRMCRLKLKVFPLVRNVFVATGNSITLFRSTFASFLTSREYLLMSSKFLFRFTEMAGVRDLFAVRINDKGVKPHINAECRLNGDFNRVWNLNDDCGVPTGRLLGDGQCLNFAVGQWSMVSNLQVSDFRDNYTGKLPMDIANQIVRQVTKGHRPIPSFAFEAWEARFTTCFDTAKECFVCFIQTANRILENVAMETGKRCRFLFQVRQSVRLCRPLCRLAGVFVGLYTLVFGGNYMRGLGCKVVSTMPTKR